MDLKYTLAAAASLLVIPLLAAGCTDRQQPTEASSTPAMVVTIEPTTAASGVPTAPASTEIKTAVATISPSAMPTPSTAPTVAKSAPKPVQPTPVSTTSKGKQAALTQLKSITVAEANYGVQYNRTGDFGPAWEDVDHNGCDTRNDMLKRDLTNITYRSNDPGCTVATGTLRDPYTGQIERFVRGPHSADQQIDHVIPLHYNWLHGGYQWNSDRRLAYANDPYVLLTVDGSANMQKSDSGPADWMPSNVAYRCTYVEKFTGIAAKYDLSLSRRDFAKIHQVLNTCK